MPEPSFRGFGARRTLAGREQTNMGPCRRCGKPVWLYSAAERTDEPPIHKAICADTEAAALPTRETL